jgi:hypothetical protein
VLFAFLAVYNICTNFEFVKLPVGGQPIAAYEGGMTLLVHTDPDTNDLVLGDVVMFSLDSGAATFGRLCPPPGTGGDVVTTDTGYWILGDNPAVEYVDSISLGAISPERIVGRVLFPLGL